MVYPPVRPALASHPPGAAAPARVVLAVVSALLLGLGIITLGGCATGTSGKLSPRYSFLPLPAPEPAPATGDPWDLRLSRPSVGDASGQPVQLAASRPFLQRAGSWLGAGGRSRWSLRPAGTSVRALVARKAKRLAPCFAQARGVVQLELLIRPSGRVGRIWTPGTAPAAVRRCVRQRALRWTFGPLPQTIRHRLTLRALGEEL